MFAYYGFFSKCVIYFFFYKFRTNSNHRWTCLLDFSITTWNYSSWCSFQCLLLPDPCIPSWVNYSCLPPLCLMPLICKMGNDPCYLLMSLFVVRNKWFKLCKVRHIGPSLAPSQCWENTTVIASHSRSEA